jgi:deferrochelatase/peroxidase EfeB
VTRFNRRGLLAGGLALGAGAALDRAALAGGAEPEPTAPTAHAVRFEGPHQAGILTPRPQQAIFAAFDAIAPDRAELAAGLHALSDRARRLTAGYTPLIGAADEGPTPDSGILGGHVPPDALTVTIGFGASLFDDRYGLAGRKPRHLKPMTTFPDDDLVAEETHGDVLLQLCANTSETLLHALRDLMRATRGQLADGTSNPDPRDAKLMDRLVWAGAGEPAWARGGTYEVVRIIRNRVEFWDRVALSEQELMIGRQKISGAPLGRRREHDDPGYGEDPKGERIPLDAHMRLANPRTAESDASRILRRPYNYSRGIDASGQLDMGLIFCCFQADVGRQFEAVQRRLAGEPLVDYVVPTGGGYFFVPPGATDGRDFVGSGLLV